jgi:2-methylisocitrate lyase-like PEP mutase family enzyme
MLQIYFANLQKLR